eukprot:m51a1_g8564 hypothetical protein (73) ;mRNA; f:182930-183309
MEELKPAPEVALKAKVRGRGVGERDDGRYSGRVQGMSGHEYMNQTIYVDWAFVAPKSTTGRSQRSRDRSSSR